MILHADRGAAGAPTIRNGVVLHDSEGQEGTLPWGQLASAQLVAFLARPGDRPSTTRPGGFYGSGYSAVACEDSTYVTVADDNVGPYHCGGGINPNMWSICIPGRASQTRDQWLGDVSRQYIRAAARYVVDRWNHDKRVWPLEFVPGARLRALEPNKPNHPAGYTSHAQVTVSKLTSTDHSDPGPAFPWDVLAADIAALTNDVAPPMPTPPSTSTGDEPMFTNSEPRTFQGQRYDPRKIFWYITEDGQVRHITRYGEVLARGGDSKATGVPNSALDELGA